jgi:hypothetical protein
VNSNKHRFLQVNSSTVRVQRPLARYDYSIYSNPCEPLCEGSVISVCQSQKVNCPTRRQVSGLDVIHVVRGGLPDTSLTIHRVREGAWYSCRMREPFSKLIENGYASRMLDIKNSRHFSDMFHPGLKV